MVKTISKTVAVIGSFDSKGPEYDFLIAQIKSQGFSVVEIDFGVLDDSNEDLRCTNEEVASEAGYSLEDVRALGDRGKALEVMTIGAKKLLRNLHDRDEIHACIGMGGGGGTAVISSAMQELPIGLPKLILSTVASGDVSPYVGVKDITMMYSVVDIAGLNRISKTVIQNAAMAICGMLHSIPIENESRKLIATSMFGVTTKCVTRAREALERSGYEVIVFHATGSGGRSMEALIESGYFSGVLDITTTEWCDELVGGVLSAGPNRLEAASSTGIPQVVSLGALDMVNFWAMDTIPSKFDDRLFHIHNSNVTLMRVSPDEAEKLGRIIAQKLSRATGPTKLLVPLKGVSELDKEEGPFYDPEANKRMFSAIRDHLDSHVELVEVDAHINDDKFADELASALISLL